MIVVWITKNINDSIKIRIIDLTKSVKVISQARSIIHKFGSLFFLRFISMIINKINGMITWCIGA